MDDNYMDTVVESDDELIVYLNHVYDNPYTHPYVLSTCIQYPINLYPWAH